MKNKYLCILLIATCSTFLETSAAAIIKKETETDVHQSKNDTLIEYITIDWLDISAKNSAIKRIIEEGASVDAISDKKTGQSLLMLAIQSDEANVVKLLLDMGAKVNYQKKNGATPLIDMCLNTSINLDPIIVELLLKGGASVNISDNRQKTPLIAVLERHGQALKFDVITNIVKMLINRGADVNAVDEDGHTPIMKAALNNHLKSAEILLNAGANINAKDPSGNTALMFAAKKANNKMVKLLIDNAAEINVIDNRGNTALMQQVMSKNPESVKLLLYAGTRLDITNKNGDNALELVQYNYYNSDVIAIFIEYFLAQEISIIPLPLRKLILEMVSETRQYLGEQPDLDEAYEEEEHQELTQKDLDYLFDNAKEIEESPTK